MSSRVRALLALLVVVPVVRASGAGPDVIFVLLDTTRADRLSALGNAHAVTPVLDGLAAAGVLFRRHFANAHATRSSMPQLMSGRYYHQNILGTFRPDEHPREFPFTRPDPEPTLLPALLRTHGYRTLGVSAHPWVVADSEFGRQFDQLELVPFPARRGHGDASQVVDRAIALWQDRARDRPLFLYLHLMDMHMPRPLPDGEPRFPVPGFDWRARFSPTSVPLFDRDARRWAGNDARGFDENDRRHFAAVYDTALSATDAQLGRLLATVRADDPELRHTLLVVAADHGEELGEDGRIDHTDSLADGVQHIPWILAGVGVHPGQRSDRITENVDVTPTVLALVGLPPPPAATTDGVPQVSLDGWLCRACGKTAAYYAWEDYRAVRTGHYLLRQYPAHSFRGRCDEAELLYRLDGRHRTIVAPTGRRGVLAARLRRRLTRRLDRRERAFRSLRYLAPATSFLVRPDYWQVENDPVRCLSVDATTDPRVFTDSGWLWSGRGVIILEPPSRGLPALAVTVDVPRGVYRVEAAVVPTPRRPWLFGFHRWARKTFLPSAPTAFVPLGTAEAHAHGLSLTIPSQVATRQHVVALRLTPPGVTPAASGTGVEDEQQRRLKALGYVQ